MIEVELVTGQLEYLHDEIAGLEIDSALALIAERTRVATRGSGVAIALSDGAGYVCRASSGSAPDLGVHLHPTAGLSGECIRTSQIVRCYDTDTDPRADSVACRRLRLRSLVILPLKRETEMVGVLEAFFDQPHAFESADVLMLRLVGELIVSLVCPEAPLAAAETSAAPGAPASEILKPEKPVAAVVEIAKPQVTAPPAPKPLPVAESRALEPAPEPAVAAKPVRLRVEPTTTLYKPAVVPPVITTPEVPPSPTVTTPSRSPVMAILLIALGTVVGIGGSVWYQKGQLGSTATRALQVLGQFTTTAAKTSPETTPAPPANAPEPNSPDRQVSSPPQRAKKTAAHPSRPAEPRRVAPAALAPTTQAAPSSQPASVKPPPTTLQTSSDVAGVTPPPLPTSATAGLPSNAVAGSTTTAAPQPPAPQPSTAASAFPPATPSPSVSQGASGGKLIRRVEPQYPPMARAIGLQGRVELRATITTKGTIGNLKVMKGEALLAGAAVEAVQQWRYEPYVLNGQPVEMETDIIVNFVLPRR